MTDTITETADERAERVRATHNIDPDSPGARGLVDSYRYLEYAWPKRPTAQSLAAPIIRGLYAFHEVSELAEEMPFAAELDAETMAQAAELVATVRRAIDLCDVAVRRFVSRRATEGAIAGGLRQLLESISDIAELTATVDGDEVFRLGNCEE